MEYYDITPLLNKKTPVFPGDQPFERTLALEFASGDHLELSWIKTSLHIGAHADAPNHYHKDGVGIDQLDLNYYLGPCQVVDARHVGSRRILPADINLKEIKLARVLFKTESFLHEQDFQLEFTSLSPELIDALAQLEVCLVGIDTPSVDPADSKDLPSHAALYRNNLAVLEGINLNQVAAGCYQLIALPLAIEGADASPVRAILLPWNAAFG